MEKHAKALADDIISNPTGADNLEKECHESGLADTIWYGLQNPTGKSLSKGGCR